MKKILILCSSMTAIAGFGTANIINEVWQDGERLTQDLPNNSMAWYSTAGSSNVSSGVGFMTQLTGGSGRHIIGYFTDSGSPVSIADGGFMTVNFKITFDRATPLGNSNDFRMGVWNSNGERVAEDNHKGTSTGNPNTAFENYEGYVFSGGVESSRSISLRRKDGASDPILIASTSVYNTLGSTESDHTTLDPNVEYTGSLNLARTGGDLEITYSMDLGATNFVTISRTDSTGYFDFDTVGFQLGSNIADGFTLSQVEVVSVPEPETFGLMLGMLGLASVIWYRRKGRQS